MSANRVGLDWQIAGRTGFIALLLLWPLIIFGSPAYFSDSLSYYKGGRAAVAFVESKLGVESTPSQPRAKPAPIDAPPPGSAPPANAVAAPEVAEAKGARSVLYSVAAYVLGAPRGSLLLLAVGQALATAFIIAVAMGVAGVRRAWHIAVIGILMACATPAACVAMLTVPDIWAGLLIAALVCITVTGERLSVGIKMALVMLAGFAVTSHLSHPPIAAGLFVLGGLWLWFGPDRRPRMIAWLLAPLVLGVAATVVSGYIGFGTVSLAAKRFPLALARSVEDGPARWYLESHCATKRYAVCEVFGNKMPRTVPEFMWEPNGLDGRATAEQMDRIRDEEQEILVEAARAYPSEQTNAVIRNIALQTITFGFNATRFENRVELDAAGMPHMITGERPYPHLIHALEWLSVLTAFAGIVWIGWHFRTLTTKQRAAAFLVIAGIAGNDVVCAVFSGVADRYQARVIWLVPLLALLFLLGGRARRHHAAAG